MYSWESLTRSNRKNSHLSNEPLYGRRNEHSHSPPASLYPYHDVSFSFFSLATCPFKNLQEQVQEPQEQLLSSFSSKSAWRVTSPCENPRNAYRRIRYVLWMGTEDAVLFGSSFEYEFGRRRDRKGEDSHLAKHHGPAGGGGRSERKCSWLQSGPLPRGPAGAHQLVCEEGKSSRVRRGSFPTGLPSELAEAVPSRAMAILRQPDECLDPTMPG